MFFIIAGEKGRGKGKKKGSGEPLRVISNNYQLSMKEAKPLS